MPLECFHGNGYSESVEAVRSEDGKIRGLQLKFLMEGEPLIPQEYETVVLLFFKSQTVI